MPEQPVHHQEETESDQQIILFYPESWHNGNLQLSITRELVSEQRLTCAVIVILFGHFEPPEMK